MPIWSFVFCFQGFDGLIGFKAVIFDKPYQGGFSLFMPPWRACFGL
jgi:hypothetical protein